MTDDNVKRVNDWLTYFRNGILGLFAAVLAMMILFLAMFILMQQQLLSQQNEILGLQENQIKLLTLQGGVIDILKAEVKK